MNSFRTKVLTGGILLLALALPGILALRMRGPEEARPRKPAARVLTPAEERAVAGEIYRSSPPARTPAASAPSEEARLARAMDDSVARGLVQNLKEAAASDNKPLRDSMIGALGRSAASARPILQAELAEAGDPRIRSALEEALAGCR